MPTKKAHSVAATKKPAAKTGAKSVGVTKAGATRDLVYAGDPQSFWTTDGAILNSLVALRDALAVMDNEVFAHHVAKDKNDFAEWVATVLDDSACARALRKVKTPASAHTVVVRHLKFYRI